MDVAEDSGIIKLVLHITSTCVFIGGAYTCTKISFAVPTIHDVKKYGGAVRNLVKFWCLGLIFSITRGLVTRKSK